MSVRRLFFQEIGHGLLNISISIPIKIRGRQIKVQNRGSMNKIHMILEKGAMII